MKPDSTHLIPGRAKLALAAGFGALLAILIMLGIYAARAVEQARKADSESTRLYLGRREALMNFRRSVYAASSDLRDYLVDPNELQYRMHADSADKARAEVFANLTRYQKVSGEYQRVALRGLEDRLRAYWRIAERGLKLSDEHRRISGYRLLADELGPARESLLTMSEQLDQGDEAAFRAMVLENAQFLNQLQLRLWAVISLSLLVGAIVAALTFRYLTRLEAEATERYQQSMAATAKSEQLSHRLLVVQEEERKSLARELHDEVGQALGALLMDLGQAKGALPRHNEEVLTRLTSASELGEQLLQSIRDISLLLRPSMLDELGLLPALNWQAREINRRTGMLVTVSSDDDDLDLEEELRTTVYRVVQEALQNASRHSGAQAAEVGIAHRDGHLQIMVRDDGKGFDPGRISGLGLMGMQERISHLAGKFRINSAPGQGTIVMIDLPLRPVDEKTAIEA